MGSHEHWADALRIGTKPALAEAKALRPAADESIQRWLAWRSEV